MGYFLIPETTHKGVPLQLIIQAATARFIKTYKVPDGTTRLDGEFNLKRNVVTISCPETGDKETYTFAELGFL